VLLRTTRKSDPERTESIPSGGGEARRSDPNRIFQTNLFRIVGNDPQSALAAPVSRGRGRRCTGRRACASAASTLLHSPAGQLSCDARLCGGARVGAGASGRWSRQRRRRFLVHPEYLALEVLDLIAQLGGLLVFELLGGFHHLAAQFGYAIVEFVRRQQI